MSKIKIVITTGDLDGIGLEVTTKALNNIGPKKDIQFIVWRDKDATPKYLKLLDQKFSRVTVNDLDQALVNDKHGLIDISSSFPPAFWVEQSAVACFKKKAAALVTGPLSKTSIQKSGLDDLGHTDILKRISKAKSVNMGFLGSKFNVLLATGHLPISELASSLELKKITTAIEHAQKMKLGLSKAKRRLPIGVLGLNPHAGESGLIGHEELSLFPKIKKFALEKGILIEGPLVPDAAFLERNWNKFSLYVALYHDQGLIPFKLVHGQNSGVHISVGIPFIRTSVDHGTAKDIFGKNKANPNSMNEAITLAIKLARQS
jgi:4-hydroxythreonine-4-phosphate dehydrogenase